MRLPSMLKLSGLSSLALALVAPVAQAGPYDPQVGQPGSSQAVSALSPQIVGWASSVVSFDRGKQDITNPSSPLTSVGNATDILGSTTSRVLSLGDGGAITLGFDTAIANGAGADFAVFENGFLSGSAGLAFLELAVVEVSSDGVNFFRFPSVSLTPTGTQVGGFALIDASNLHNIAGKYIAGYGTGFDLDDLVGVSNLLDVNNVIQVRVIDVVGSIDPAYGTYDSLGNLINDPFKTPFASSGFDLSGVAVLNAAQTVAVPEPTALVSTVAGLGLVGLAALRRSRRNP